MKKLLFILAWIVHVYSGDYGHLYYECREEPKFVYYGRWIYFVDKYDRKTYVSAGSTVIIREEK